MMKNILLVLSLLVLVVSAHALTVDFIPQQASSVVMEKDSSISLQYLVKNNDFTKQCVSFSTDKNSSFLKLSISQQNICLNAFESQSLTFTIQTASDITSEKDYDSKVLMTSLDGTFVRDVNVILGDNDFLGIKAFQKNICMQSLQDKVSVELVNDNNYSLDLDLGVDSPSLIASVEDSHVNLHSNTTAFVDVTVNVNDTFKGDYSATFIASNPQFIMLKKIPITVIDCPPKVEPTFDLTLPKTKLDMNKGSSFRDIAFKLKNLLDQEQTVTIVADSRLPTKTTNIVLGPNETVNATFQVLPSLDILAGTYDVQLFASGLSFTQQKTVAVKLFPESNITVRSIEQLIQVSQNSTQSVSLIFENKGDYDESLTVQLNNSLTGIIPTLYNQVFNLNKGQSAEIRLDITSNTQSFLGLQELELKVSGKKIQVISIPFKVVEEHFVPSIGVIDIASYPKVISISPGENVVLPIVVQNTSSEELKDFSLRLIGLPEGQDFNVLIPTLSTIGAGEIKTIQMTVKAGSSVRQGQYPLVLQATTNKYLDIKEFQMIVQPSTENASGSGSGLSGLVGFASSPLGFVALIVIVAFFAFAFYGLFMADKSRRLQEIKL